MLLDRARCFLLIVDMQERLVPAVLEREKVVGNALRLVAAARRLAVPVLMTEHCPAKIGPLVSELRVLQSALSLLDAGYRPVVVSDAVSSRKAYDRDVALQRLRDAGIGLVTTEMVLFEWLERGDAPEFRELLPLIKSGGEGQ
jgi:nicotinamidase-related amidase